MAGQRTIVLFFALGVVGCGQAATVTTVTVTRHTPPTTIRHTASHTPPQRTEPEPARPSYKACDQNISVNAETTTCGFAQNAFYAYWSAAESSTTLRVLSPALGRRLATICAERGGLVRCTTDDGGLVRFPIRAVASYTPEMAAAFAAAHGLKPPPTIAGSDDDVLADDLDAIDEDDAAIDRSLEDLERDYPDVETGSYAMPDTSNAPGVSSSQDFSGVGGVNDAGYPKNQYVRPHMRRDGTYVQGYWRNSPNDGLPTCKVIDC